MADDVIEGGVTHCSLQSLEVVEPNCGRSVHKENHVHGFGAFYEQEKQHSLMMMK